MKHFCGIIIGKSGPLGGLVSSKIFLFPTHFNSCLPSFPNLVNSFIFRCGRIIFLSIAIVFSKRTFSKVLPAVVQSIAIFVIGQFLRLTPKNYSMHIDFRGESYGVETPTTWNPQGTPIPLIQPLKIGGIYDGVLALRQCDKTIGLVKRLSDCVAFHAVGINSSWHRSSSQGLLQLSRYSNTINCEWCYT